MNFHVYLDDELGRKVEKLCLDTHKKRNTIIREALHFYLDQCNGRKWPESVLAFNGIPNFPSFESLREDLPDDTRETFLD